MSYLFFIISANSISVFAYLLFENILSKSVKVSGRLLNVILGSSRTGELSPEFKKLYIALSYHILLLALVLFATVGTFYIVIDFLAVGVSWLFFLVSTTPAFIAIYFFVTRRDINGYSTNSQAFHEFFLENLEIGKYLFAKYINGRSQQRIRSNGIIIVTGLARSGTTALIRAIFEKDSKKFSALTYSQMPLLAYPLKFNWPSSKKVNKERSHNDGIKIGLDSVEAFDEYLFKLLTNSEYIGYSSLKIHELKLNAWRDYFAYINKFSNGRIYITKNNNFILRLKSFLNLKIETSKVVVIVRRPDEVAMSLLRQHINQSDHQRKDPFVRSYMGWLGHFEFGLDHKPFDLKVYGEVQFYPVNDVNYWLSRWIDYHTYLLSLDLKKLHVVTYDDFCSYPELVLEKIIGRPLSNNDVLTSSFQKTSYEFSNRFNQSLLLEAKKLFVELEKYSILRLT